MMISSTLTKFAGKLTRKVLGNRSWLRPDFGGFQQNKSMSNTKNYKRFPKRFRRLPMDSDEMAMINSGGDPDVIPFRTGQIPIGRMRPRPPEPMLQVAIPRGVIKKSGNKLGNITMRITFVD